VLRHRARTGSGNAYPFCENNVLDVRGSNYVNAPATAQGIYFNQITKQSSRVFLADALNGNGAFAGQSTYLLAPVVTPVTETNNITNLKSWHTAGALVTITLFDGHGEKRNVTASATALIDP
jgi:hypothetical protein